jgi:Helitron helicase-like domain at N-terminus
MEKCLPSFFITINPADVYNPLVKFLRGADIDIDNLLPEHVPNYWEQSILIAKNPFVAAKFFNVYMKAFINSILAYNLKKNNLDDFRSCKCLLWMC